MLWEGWKRRGLTEGEGSKSMVVGRKEKEVMDFGRVRVVAFFVDSKTQTDYRRVGGVGEGRVSRDRASRRDGREREKEGREGKREEPEKGTCLTPGVAARDRVR